MDNRKRNRITRDRLLLADYEAWAIDGTPSRYLAYTLPKKFKIFFQFKDHIRNGYWSVELLFEIEDQRAKLIEAIPRGLTYKRGLFIDGNGGKYIYKNPTESPAGWQFGLLKNNLTKLIAHSIELGVSSFTYLGNKKWKLEGVPLSEKEFQEIRAEVALKKRELFTEEKAQEVRILLEQERKRAKDTGSRYRGNEAISEFFGVSLKTAEKWSARVRVSAQKGRKNKKQERRRNAKSKKARR